MHVDVDVDVNVDCILMSFFQVACQYENMRIYVTDDDNDNNNDDVDVDVDGNVDNNSQVNLHSPLTVHVSEKGLSDMKEEGDKRW